MSDYIDYGNSDFRSVINSNFVDKSGLLTFLNNNLDTENKFICISRPRRFGKSVAAKMAYAYYDRSCDSSKLFNGLEITKNPDFKTHLNKYPTIYIDWNRFANIPKNEIVTKAQKYFVADLKKSYPFLQEQESFANALAEINDKTGDRFILIIDEWDMLVRDVDLLVHLGYLSYEPETQRVRIPNTEVAIEFKNAVSVAGWGELSKSVGASLRLLEDTITLKKEKIARAFDDYHFEASSLLNGKRYNFTHN